MSAYDEAKGLEQRITAWMGPLPPSKPKATFETMWAEAEDEALSAAISAVTGTPPADDTTEGRTGAQRCAEPQDGGHVGRYVTNDGEMELRDDTPGTTWHRHAREIAHDLMQLGRKCPWGRIGGIS